MVDEVEKIAKRKGCTAGQVAIAWIRAQSGKHGLPVIIPIPGASTDKRVSENIHGANVNLAEEEMNEISEILKNFPPSGHRYPAAVHDHLNG